VSDFGLTRKPAVVVDSDGPLTGCAADRLAPCAVCSTTHSKHVLDAALHPKLVHAHKQFETRFSLVTWNRSRGKPIYDMVRTNASGPEIGSPGKISAGF
jgi:hypothetical protein